MRKKPVKNRRNPVSSYNDRVKKGLAKTDKLIGRARRDLVEKLSKYMKVKHGFHEDLDTNPDIFNDEVAKSVMEWLRDEERALLRDDLQRKFKKRPIDGE